MSSETYTIGLACEKCPATHTIAYDNNKNKKRGAPLFKPFLFLSLPIEIRLRIYHYLAPNTRTPPFRNDGRPCCPSILRTNRTVYEEAIFEWYSLMPYKASICGRGLMLHLHNLHSLNPTILADEPLPWMLQAIKYLDLQVRLEKISMPGIGREFPSRHLAVHQILHAWIRTGAGNLQRLRVELGVMPNFFVFYKDQPDRLRQALEGNLSAFRNLHGLAKARIVTRIPHVTNHIFGLNYPNALLIPWKMEFMAVARVFSDDLEHSMTI